jgi:uncharacterized protein (TIGR02246 family)
MATTTNTAVEEVVEAYGDKLRSSDVEGAVDLFTDDAVVMEPGQPTAIGRQQIEAAYQRIREDMHIDVSMQVADTLVDGDLASVRSRASGTVTIRATGAVLPIEARELFVLRRVGSIWRIAQYMFQEVPNS